MQRIALGLRRFSVERPPIRKMPRIMHPDWYRTPQADDDVRMIGDYPDVPATSYQLRDPYASYFDQQNRRNYGEAVPEDYEPLIMWSFDHETTYGKGWVLGGLGGFFGVMYVVYNWLGRYESPLKGELVRRSSGRLIWFRLPENYRPLTSTFQIEQFQGSIKWTILLNKNTENLFKDVTQCSDPWTKTSNPSNMNQPVPRRSTRYKATDPLGQRHKKFIQYEQLNTPNTGSH